VSSHTNVRPVVRLANRKVCVEGYRIDDYDSTSYLAREIRMYYRWLRQGGVTRWTARAVISGLLMMQTRIERSDDD